MSKYRTTKKAMKESYDYIIGTGAANLYYLLKYRSPFAYSARAEGWACDYYDVNGVLISSGYDYIDSKRTKKADYKMISEYNGKAREISGNYDLDYEQKKEMVESLLNDFIKEATGGKIK
ncbi:MAG TPA: hypothetical protein DER56_06285 [Thermosipho africanus]|nr:hypothetical protein [Thermosipho africanus]